MDNMFTATIRYMSV